MIKIKNTIARTIKNIGKLFTFAIMLITGFGICCLLGSWTLDPNGNLIGENIIDYPNLSFELNKSLSTSQGNAWNHQGAKVSQHITTFTIGETYSISNTGVICFYKENGTFINSAVHDPYLTYGDITFTIPNEFGYLRFETLMTTQEIMCNRGNSVKPWEPYGLYYSQTNYDNMQTAKYNEGYAEGYTNGYNQATTDVINQYAIPIIEAYQIQQVVIHAENSSNEDLGRILFSIYEDHTNNELELSNINTITGSTKNVIEIYLVNNLQITEFKTNQGFISVALGSQTYNASYDGQYYIINQTSLNASQVVNIIRIEISTNVRAINIIAKGSNLSIDGTKNAYESGKEIGKQQQADQDQATINNLQTQYDTLLEHYQNAQLENPLSKMVIAVADIPLNLFHNMFNFDIMGFNLAAFILGIITILLVAYVIKLFL